jgi:hypothetical protein
LSPWHSVLGCEWRRQPPDDKGVVLQLGGWAWDRQLLAVKNKPVRNFTMSLRLGQNLRVNGLSYGIWNIKSLYRTGCLVTVSKELSKYILDLEEVQVRWEGSSTEPKGEYTFCHRKGNENHELSTGLFVHKRVEVVGDRMSYIILRGRWCHIIPLNIHAPTEDETVDVKDSFYEELERVFDKFLKYHQNLIKVENMGEIESW